MPRPSRTGAASFGSILTFPKRRSKYRNAPPVRKIVPERMRTSKEVSQVYSAEGFDRPGVIDKMKSEQNTCARASDATSHYLENLPQVPIGDWRTPASRTTI